MIRPLSDDEKAANWQACRKYLGRYILALCLPGLLVLWAAGYAQGWLDGVASRNERSHNDES